MTKPIKAMAVVSKSNPRLSVNEIYSYHDSLSIRVNDDEAKIKVMIVPVKGSVSVKKGPRAIKRR
jgi:hypothetical protein